jgi:3-oxoacyl-[acyl-carrier protein] reductase
MPESTTTKRTILITGASKGIGRALSEKLAASGLRGGNCAERRRSHVPRNARPSRSGRSPRDGRCTPDLTARFSFDGVVNNVGFVRLGRIGEIDIDQLEESFQRNLTPAVQTVQAALPAMRGKNWGRVINLSSLTILGVADRTAYAGAKSAISSFTRTWALELAQYGITVNAVAPGSTETEMFRTTTPAGSEAERRFLSMIPMKRLGKPEEIAALIAFLLSEEAGFITGQTLFADGGASIGKAAA